MAYSNEKLSTGSNVTSCIQIATDQVIITLRGKCENFTRKIVGRPEFTVKNFNDNTSLLAD
jgi:hypothetical protein